MVIVVLVVVVVMVVVGAPELEVPMCSGIFGPGDYDLCIYRKGGERRRGRKEGK